MDRRTFLKTVCASSLAVGFSKAFGAPLTRNVLLICVDDLRPVMGCFGGRALTPNLDRLAEDATIFLNHYVQWPVCGPSRAAMLSGLRPDTTGIHGNNSKVAENAPPERPPMPRHFRDQGYFTQGFGKVYHGKGDGPGCGWSEPPWQPPSGWTCYVDFPLNGYKKGDWRPAYEIFDGPDSRHGDYQTADQVISAIEKHKDGPFFIAAGFYKPHLPFVAPKWCWDLYDDSKIEALTPLGLPELAADFMYNYGEIDAYGLEEGKLFSRTSKPTPEQARELIHAYYAAASFTDSHVGRILKRLDELGLSDSTAVVLWGDHGFHLGDHARWAKHTQFENAMRSPLMARFPGAKVGGRKTHALVETVDIYPSLCDYCGIALPGHLEGKSFRPIVETGGDGKRAAYSQISPVGGPNKDLMAYTVRTPGFRYVEWRDRSKSYRLVYRELYDLRENPQEEKNVAEDPKFSPIVAEHQTLVLTGFSSLAEVRRTERAGSVPAATKGQQP